MVTKVLVDFKGHNAWNYDVTYGNKIPCLIYYYKFKEIYSVKNSQQKTAFLKSKPVSRVLYLTAIYLGPLFLKDSSHLRTDGLSIRSKRGVAPGGVYIDRQVAMPLVSPYLTFPPLPGTYT